MVRQCVKTREQIPRRYSQRRSSHVKMIPKMQSINEENNKYSISSHKMYHFVPIYNENNSFDG